MLGKKTKLDTCNLLRRICVVCQEEFLAKRPSSNVKTCSPACCKELRSKSAKAAWADPVKGAKRLDAHRAAMKKWHKNPVNAAKFAARSSARMKKLHKDPDFQVRRDKRSSRVMKENWKKHREHLTQLSIERYYSGSTGLNQGDVEKRKRAAAKWIMKRAQEALHTETNYNEVFREAQARIRAENPFSGEPDTKDYYEHCKLIGTLTATSPECKSLANSFLSEAIPRFAEEWNKRKKEGK